MKAIRLLFVPDEELLEFKRLSFEEVEVPLRRVLLEGIHPGGLCVRRYCPSTDKSRVDEALTKKLNEPCYQLEMLLPFGLCPDIDNPGAYSYHMILQQDKSDRLGTWLSEVKKRVYFTEGTTFAHLLNLARERLRKNWNREVVLSLLLDLNGHDLVSTRRFLKAKDKRFKCRSWEELHEKDVHRVLSLDDFSENQMSVIRHGISGPIIFRKNTFLKDITTEDGLFCLKPTIDKFELSIPRGEGRKLEVLYFCQMQGRDIRLIPYVYGPKPQCFEQRASARRIAETYATGKGRYVFTTTIEEAERMLEDGGTIRFPQLDYIHEADMELPGGRINPDVRVCCYRVGQVITSSAIARVLKEALEFHGKRTSGIKEELVNELEGLLVELYRKHKAQLDRFFSTPYMRIDSGLGSGTVTNAFPVSLNGGPRSDLDGAPCKETLLAIYILKHLRGSRVLSSKYENTTFSVRELVRSVLKGEVKLSGAFVRAREGERLSSKSPSQ